MIVNEAFGNGPMTYEEACGLAATAWCGKKTRNKVMDPDLALEFAKILQREVNHKREKQIDLMSDAMHIYRLERKPADDCAYPEEVKQTHDYKIEMVKGTPLRYEPEQISYIEVQEREYDL